MTRTNSGLTTIYNRFHDKYDEDPEIKTLRSLHARMDRLVLDAYGWTALQPAHEFILEYEESVSEDQGGQQKRREPWRYRWTDECRDDALTRLLDLNRERGEEERMSSVAETVDLGVGDLTGRVQRKRGRRKKDDLTATMFPEKAETE